jgi:hypothetical protein
MIFCCCAPPDGNDQVVDLLEESTAAMDSPPVHVATKATKLPAGDQAPPVKATGQIPQTITGGDFQFTFVMKGALGINVKKTRFEITGIRAESCIAARNAELPPECQLRIKDKVIAVGGKMDTPAAMMKQVAATPEGEVVVLAVVKAVDDNVCGDGMGMMEVVVPM